MELDSSLLNIAKLLLSEDDEKTPEILLRQVLEATGAERGFIVVGQGDVYDQKFHVRFDREKLSRHERDFSRSLVRRAIHGREVLYSPDVQEDPRFASMESVRGLGRSCVLACPLRQGQEVYGVVYLEHGELMDCFAPEAQRFLAGFAELAGGFLRKALERETWRERSRSLERDLFARHDFAGIVTADPKMIALLKLVAQVADSDASILVRGETGTGKELVAHALHLNSGRRSKPFVPVHCTALPGQLLESELFGYVKGAFTGAQQNRAGRIASADGGTLFLDEVAELPLDVQSKLLRFLQFGEIQRLGLDRVEKVDVRVVAATHKDLGAMAQAGQFRQDLYFRLKVVELTIPALRERRSDIALLLSHFLRKHWRRPGEEPRWSHRARHLLQAYAYPGNIRELEHLVQRACLLATGPELDLEVLPPEVTSGQPVREDFAAFTNDELKASRENAVNEVEDRFLRGLMDLSAGNVSHAARHAGVPRSYLQRLLAKHRGESE